MACKYELSLLCLSCLVYFVHKQTNREEEEYGQNICNFSSYKSFNSLLIFESLEISATLQSF